MVETGFALLNPQLGLHEYSVGNGFTIADAALFYAVRWAPQQGISLPANVARHLERMRPRPAIRKIMELWGEA
jgi:glutathione S-transferase